MTKGVLFDLDGVICDTAKLHYQAWRMIAKEFDSDITEKFNDNLKGVDRPTSLKRLLKEIDVEVTDKMFEDLQRQKNNYYVKLLERLSSSDVLPGINKLFKDLKANNIKIAIASASRNAPNILEKIGLLDQVDTIANPDHVKASKPAPDIFLLAAKQLDLQVHECIGIEDAQAGIDSLNDANIRSIAIGSYLKNATTKLSSTEELTINIIKSMD